MLVLTLPLFRSRPSAVHALFLSLLLVGTFALLLGAKGEVVRAMGRKEDLTGRTEIWKIVLPMVPNSIGGAGFETFWLGPRMERINIMIGGISAANEAHNGYIEVYLNLGWLGLALIASIIVQGYGRTINAFRRDSALGALLLANVVAMALYNIGEAGFRMLNPAWFLLLLSILTASGAIRVGEKPRRSQAWNLPTVPGKLGCPRPQPDLGGSCSEVGL